MKIWYIFLLTIAFVDFTASISTETTQHQTPVIFISAIIIALISKLIEGSISSVGSQTEIPPRKKFVPKPRSTPNKPLKNKIREQKPEAEIKSIAEEKKIHPTLHNYQDDIPARLVALAGLVAKGRISIDEYERRRNFLITKSAKGNQ